MSDDHLQELITSLELLVIQTRRGVSLPDNPDRLCAIDNQTIQRAEKALASAKTAQQVAA